ncbi:MAG: MFS transporter [Chloroflexi bacterium]|nr:MFS transporter [Chloroflexota bacterium]
MTSPTQAISSYRWVVMGVWFTSAVAGFMVVSTLGILLPSISEDLGLSPSQQGMLGSAAFWGNMVLAIPLSWWTSRFGPKILTTVTLALGTLFIFVQGVAPTLIMLIIGRMAFGVAMLAREPARAHLIRQWFHPNEAILANSVSNVFFGVVVGGGMVVTPFILSEFGDDWRMIFYLFGVAFFLLTLLWIIVGRERPFDESQIQVDRPERNVVRIALSHSDIWIAGVGFIGSSMSWAAFLNFYPTMMLDTYELPLRWTGAILALGIFVGGLWGLAVGYYVSIRDGRRGLLMVFGVLMAVSYVGLIYTDSVPLLIAATVLNGVAWGFFPILYTVPFMWEKVRSREVAIGLSFLTVSFSIGAVLGPLVTGFLQETLEDLRTALFLVSFAGLSLTAVGFVLRFGGAANDSGSGYAAGEKDRTSALE